MMIHDLAEALDIVVGSTGHHRYRWLCSDDNADLASRDGHRRNVLALASGLPWPPPEPAPDPPPPPPSAESIRLTMLVRRCAYRSPPPCGCAPHFCGIAGANRSQLDCLACVGKYSL